MILTRLIEQIKLQIIEGLPGETAHQAMAPSNRPISSFALKDSKDHRVSSVAIVLHQNESQKVSLILIQRPHYEGAHSGQISFPGGKKDPSDFDTEYTARRECMEEVGICLDSDNCLGKLTDVFIPVSNFLVHPYLYFHAGPMEFIPDEREVSEILVVDLLHLKDPEAVSTMDIRFANGLSMRNVPCFVFGEKKVWGATALILNELREILLRLN